MNVSNDVQEMVRKQKNQHANDIKVVLLDVSNIRENKLAEFMNLGLIKFPIETSIIE